MTELRVYLPIEDLQPQFAAYMSTPMRARGYPPMQGDNSLIIEVAPALSIHRIVDLALKAAPDMEPGILFTERQFGLLELHSRDAGEVNAAGDAILKGATSGTPTTSSSNTNLTGYADDELIGRTIIFISGTAEGQAGRINDYANTSGVVTYTTLTTAPAASDNFIIV